MEPLHFYYTNRKPLIIAFQWYLGWCLGPKNDPKPANLPSWPSCSCQLQFFPSTKKKYISSSVSPRQRYNDTITLFMVWTLCSYGFSTGHGRLMVLCPDDITPCLTAILAVQRRLHRGLFAPPPSTFRRCCGKITSLECIVLIWRRGGCGAGTILLLRSWRGKEDNETQCDALIMHRALNSLIGINKN